VAAAQTGAVETDDMGAMVPRACALVQAAADKGVHILTFCELFLSPFFPNRLQEDFDCFFTEADGETLRPIREAARKAGIAIVLPFGERRADGMFNSALVADSRGAVAGIYRKTHIPAYFPTGKAGGTGSFEKLYFTPGGALPVFDVDGVKIGIQICNDRLYPEGSRVLALGGAEIIFMPIAYSRTARTL
jgi:predicted amidohydrolase